MGPGVRRGYDLTIQDKVQVNTEDTFATACAMMGIPYPQNIDGKFVEQILEPGPDQELLKTVSDEEKKPEEAGERGLGRVADSRLQLEADDAPEHH